MTESQMDRIKGLLIQLVTMVGDIKQDIEHIKQDVAIIKQNMDELKIKMNSIQMKKENRLIKLIN